MDELKKFTTIQLIEEILRRIKEQEMCNKNLMSQLKFFVAANKGKSNG